MKISSIIVHILRSPLSTPFAFSQGWVKTRSATLVEVKTDSGLTGWGEAFCQGLEAPQIAAAAITHSFTPLLLGQNPLDTEILWFKMYNQSRDFGRKGAVIAAISALDMALWDIAGQYYEQPIWQLLGGAFRHEVQPYATGFYRVQGQNEQARLAEEALRHFDNGFGLMKVKLGFGVRDDIAVMQAIKTALGTKPVTLMVDSNHAYGFAEALYLGHALAEMDVRWYEEPVAPEDYRSYADLRARLPMAIAGGENEHSVYGFKALLEARAVDIVQPDIGSCGGFTAMRHIIALSVAYGVEVNPHIWGSAVASTASMHVLAMIPDVHASLFARQPVMEYDQSDHPFRQELTEQPIIMRDSDHKVAIPQGAGLGLKIRRETLKTFSA